MCERDWQTEKIHARLHQKICVFEDDQWDEVDGHAEAQIFQAVLFIWLRCKYARIIKIEYNRGEYQGEINRLAIGIKGQAEKTQCCQPPSGNASENKKEAGEEEEEK